MLLAACPAVAIHEAAADVDDGAVSAARRRSASTTAPRVGVALKVDALGAGGDVAVGLGRRLNLRAGVRALDADGGYQVDGIDLDARLTLRSWSAYLDWFPFAGSFHVSPGAMLYNGNRATAVASVPGGETFTIGGTELMSSPMDPVNGRARLDFARVAPALVIGWGNIVPRGGSHWSVPFELGVVYTRSPDATLDLRGTACTMDGDCRDLAREPGMQALVEAEEARLERGVAPLRVLPIVSIGVGYRF